MTTCNVRTTLLVYSLCGLVSLTALAATTPAVIQNAAQPAGGDTTSAGAGIIPNGRDGSTAADSSVRSVAAAPVRIYWAGHDVQLQMGEPNTIQIHISAAPPQEAELVFQYTDANILQPLDNMTVQQGNATPLAVTLRPRAPGHCTLTAVSNVSQNVISTSDLYVRVNVLNSFGLNVLSAVVGWIYFAAWTVSFYPQVYINFRRKSVVGLNFDFLALNIVGFVCYSTFNCALFFSKNVQNEYFEEHPYGLVPVAWNDIVFALHAVFACIVTILQTLIYERGEQRVSWTARGLLVVAAVALVITGIVTATGHVNVLWFLYVFSYVKLAITIVKYVPQAYMNYRRKSTEGWSIGNVLLDFTGGFLSILQMFIDAYNFNDWSSIFGNPTKFGLGLFSVLFDCLFMFQHYVLYRGLRSSTSQMPLASAANNDGQMQQDKL